MTTTQAAIPRAPTAASRRPFRAGRRRQSAILLLIMLATVALRFYRFPGTPNGLNQDELSAGYETLSLLRGGTDRWGTHWPVYFEAFGSGQNVLFSYLNMPFIAIFGPTIVGLRLLPALLGVLTVGATFLLTRRFAGGRAGLIAAALLAACPWHVMMSRWALESNVLPPVMLLAVWALAEAYRSSRRWPLWLSLAPMALAVYAYAVAIPVVLLFVAGFLAIEFRVVRRRPAAVAASVGVVGLLTLPYGLFLLVNEVWHRLPGWIAALPFGVPLLPGSRFDETAADGPVSNNPWFLLNGFDDQRVTNVLRPFLPLGAIVLPLAAAGVYFALRGAPGRRSWVPVLWVASSLPLFFIVPLNLNRINVILLPLVMLAGIGLDGIAGSMSDRRAGRAVIAAMMTVAMLYNVSFVRDYFTRYDYVVRLPFAAGIDKALEVVRREAAPGEPIYVSDIVMFNYLYVLYYRNVDSRDFRAHAQYAIVDTQYVVRNYRNYYFLRTDPVLAAAPTYVGVFRDGETIKCAGNLPSAYTQLARAGAFRVLRCASAPPATPSLSAGSARR